jgi:hypothetical protein
VIEVRCDDDDLVGTARQEANDIGQLRYFYRLLGNVLVSAISLNEHSLERCFTLLVVTPVFPESSFEDFPRNRIVPNVLGSRSDPSTQQQHNSRRSAKL